MYGFIYITTDLTNGMQYIGKRVIKGNSEDDTYLGSGKWLKRSIKKHGEENFVREIIEYAINDDELRQLEKYLVWLAGAVESEAFYNIQDGGGGGDNTKGWSEEEKQQFSKTMSEATKGEKNGMYGKPQSAEARQKMSENHWTKREEGKRYCKSKEFRTKMSEVTKGEKNGMYGRPHTEESKLKMSISSKGKNVGAKNGNYGNHNGKTVYQWEDKEHKKLIETFISLQEAVGSFGLVGTGALKRAAKNNTLYKGYYWSY